MWMFRCPRREALALETTDQLRAVNTRERAEGKPLVCSWSGHTLSVCVCVRACVCVCVRVCCAVLCCAVLCCAVLCCAVLCCAVLCCAVLCCAGRSAEHTSELQSH